MKKTTITIALIIIGFLNISAQEKNDAEQLVKLLHESRIERGSEQVSEMLLEDKREAFTKEAAQTEKDLLNELANIYKAAFTAEEIQSIITFYSTPVGKKLLKNQEELQSKIIVKIQDWEMKLIEKALKN